MIFLVSGSSNVVLMLFDGRFCIVSVLFWCCVSVLYSGSLRLSLCECVVKNGLNRCGSVFFGMLGLLLVMLKW